MKKYVSLIVLMPLFIACGQPTLIVSQAAADAGTLPRSIVRKDMPHVSQVDHRIKTYREDISALCAPTAGADALIWLAKNGHPEITFENPYALVAELARRARTIDGGGGTLFRVLLNRMVDLVHESGVTGSYACMGRDWSNEGGGHAVFRAIDYDLLKRSLMDKDKVALIGISLCHYNARDKTYIATSSHLMVLAGYDDDRGCLVVADPNEGKALQYYKLARLDEDGGDLVDNHRFVCKTDGLYQLSRSSPDSIDIITEAAIFTLD